LWLEILGEEEEESDSEESGELSSSEESEDEEGEDERPTEIDMTDMTDAKVLSIRRQIYLTIMSSLDYEECAHKLLKNLEEGQEVRTHLSWVEHFRGGKEGKRRRKDSLQ